MMSWILTYTGKQFYPLDPDPDSICIEDIARGLSMICRFNGQTRCFYSVAEHSVLMSQQMDKPYLPGYPSGYLGLAGLLHDAAEAYVSDVARPIKPLIRGFDGIERAILKVVAGKFKIPMSSFVMCGGYDLRMLATERRQIMHPGGPKWKSLRNVEPFNITLPCWLPHEAEYAFMEQFEMLTERRQSGQIEGEEA